MSFTTTSGTKLSASKTSPGFLQMFPPYTGQARLQCGHRLPGNLHSLHLDGQVAPTLPKDREGRGGLRNRARGRT